MVKKCTKCFKVKELIHFHKDKAVKSGLMAKCKKCHSLYFKKYYQTDKGKLVNQRHSQKSRQKNKQKRNLKNKERRKVDINFKITTTLRSRLHNAIKKGKAGSAVKDLGCTVEFLKQHLESKFQPGMTWENYGLKGWHIDHILPLNYFNLTNRKQLLKACHYTNLQPLWAADNYRKNSKII